MTVLLTPADFAVHRPEGAAYALGAGVSGVFPARGSDDAAALVIQLNQRVMSRSYVFGRVRMRAIPELLVEVHLQRDTTPALVLTCLDEELLPTFATLCTEVIRRCAPSFTVKAVREVIQEWHELLGPSERLSREGELGLWGELHFLLRCPSIEGGLLAWHGPERSAVDFVGGSVAIECKTTRDRHRHTISLEQRQWGNGNVKTYLASLVVEDDASDGVLLPELVDQIKGRLDDSHDFSTRLERAGYRPSHAHTYQQKLALCESWMLPMDRVPAVRTFDLGISRIRYDVDLLGLAEHRLRPEAEAEVLTALSKSPFSGIKTPS